MRYGFVKQWTWGLKFPNIPVPGPRLLAAVSLPYLTALFAFAFSLDCPAADLPIGQITLTRGVVTIEKQGAGTAGAVRGAVFFVGDILATGNASTAQAALSDESFLNLAPESAVRVNQYRFDAEQNRRTIHFRVLRGSARWVSHRQRSPGSSLSAESGNARIAAQGFSDFVVSPAPGATEVVVLNGSVTVSHRSSLIVGEVSVGVNQRTVVRDKAPPSAPETITREQRKRHLIAVRRN